MNDFWGAIDSFEPEVAEVDESVEVSTGSVWEDIDSFEPEVAEINEGSVWDDIDSFEADSERTVFGTFQDILVSGAKSVVNTGTAAVGLADIPTFGHAGKFLADHFGFDPQATNEFLNTLHTEAQQEANNNVEAAEGFMGKVKAYLDNPSTIPLGVVETIAPMMGGGAVGQGIRKIAPKVPGLIAGAIGEGAVSAGDTAESIRQQTEDGLLTPAQAGIPILSGAGTALFGVVGGRVAQKFGLDDVNTYLADTGSTVSSQGVIKRIIGGGITEGVFEELPQSTQEIIWQNAALDKPLMDGVPEGAAAGLILGAAMGGGFNALPKKKSPILQEAKKAAADLAGVTLPEDTVEPYDQAKELFDIYSQDPGNRDLQERVAQTLQENPDVEPYFTKMAAESEELKVETPQFKTEDIPAHQKVTMTYPHEESGRDATVEVSAREVMIENDKQTDIMDKIIKCME